MMKSELNQQQILALPENLTVGNANAVLAQLLAIMNDKQTVDLSAIQYCDSGGIAVLLAAKSQYQQCDKMLYYQFPSQQVRELAHFLKVDTLLF